MKVGLGLWLRTRGAQVFGAWVRICPVEASGQARVRGRAIYILPTGAGLTCGVILLLMLVGSLNYQNNLGLLFTFLTAAIVLVSMHHAWFNLLGLALAARAGPPVFAGEKAIFEVLLTAAPHRSHGRVTPRAGEVRGCALDVEAGETARTQLALPARVRGFHPLGRLTLETAYPLGLFRAWCYLETAPGVLVYPRPADQAPLALSSGRLPLKDRGNRELGVDDFAGLRGYRPGDSLRQLDWKAYGRGRGLHVKQFGQDPGERLWFDWDLLPPADIETRLSWLCRLVLDARQRDQVFGLRLPGLEIGLGRGEEQMHRCLGALARFGQERGTDPAPPPVPRPTANGSSRLRPAWSWLSAWRRTRNGASLSG